MATIITRTTAGAAHDHAVRNGSEDASQLKHIVFGDEQAVIDPTAVAALTSIGNEVHRITRESEDEPGFAITEETNVSTRIEAHIPDGIDGIRLRAVGLLLENGVLWGYAPYLPDEDGLLKTSAFSWSIDILVLESDTGFLSLTYEPLDMRTLRDRLSQHWAELNQTLLDRLAALESCCQQNSTEAGFNVVGDDLVYSEDPDYVPLQGLDFEVNGDGDLLVTGDESKTNRLEISGDDLILSGDS